MSNNDFSVNLPWGESLRRSLSFVVAHGNQLLKISAAWFVIVLALNMLTDFPVLSMTENGNDGVSIQDLPALVLFLGTIAVAVAYTRFVVLHECGNTLWNLSFGRREWRYIWKGFVLVGAALLPLLILAVTIELSGIALLKLISLVGIMSVAIIYTRFYLIFPAAAVDNLEMTMQRSFQITKGNANKIFWSQILLSLPFGLLFMGTSVVYEIIGTENYFIKMFFAALIIAVSLLEICVKASYFGHIYQYFMYSYQKYQEKE